MLSFRSIVPACALSFILVACTGGGGGGGGGGGDGGTGTGGSGTGGTTGAGACGPMPGGLDCGSCNGYFGPPSCVDGHWTCPSLDNCPSPCGPNVPDCQDCNGNWVMAICEGFTWQCPDTCTPPSSPPPLWAGTATGDGDQSGRAVAVAPDGSIFLGGSFGGELQVQGITTTFISAEPANIYQHDALIAKLAPDGTFLWAQSFGAVGDDFIEDIAVDADGNAVVVGTYESAQTIGGASLPGGVVGGLFVVKLSPTGNLIFAKGFTGGANGTRGRVEVTPSGDILLAGDTSGTIDFGGGPLVGGNGMEAFVARLDPSGNHVYSRRFAATTGAGAVDLALTPSGDTVVLGAFKGSIDFGLGPLASKGEFDVFVLRLDANGNVTSAAGYGGPGDENPGSVVADAAGNVTLTATFATGADFGGGPLAAAVPSGVVASYAADGSFRWATPYATVEDKLYGADVFRLAAGSNDRVVLAGQFQQAFVAGTNNLPSAGELDLILAGLDGQGNWISAHRYGSTNAEMIGGVAVDAASGDILVTGSYWGVLNLGLTALDGGADGNMFWARFTGSPGPK